MGYDSNIPNMQGAVKASEIAVDRPEDIIKTVTGASDIVATEQTIRALGDALRRINYILFSDNLMTWDGANLSFATLDTACNITFRLLQTEDSVNQYPTNGPAITPTNTIDLVLSGNNSTNSASQFNSIAIPVNSVLYLQIDRNTVLAGGPTVAVNNATGGGYVGSGPQTVIQSMNSGAGMPHLTTAIGGPTQTFYIPLAMHHQWTDGTNTYNDILWIPHGIRWPANTQSTLGAVIVQGMDHYYDYAVSTYAELTSALSNLSSTGGIILVTAPMTISSITVPSGVTILSRSNRYSDPEALITVNTGMTITMQSRSALFNLSIQGSSAFGNASADELVTIGASVEHVNIRNCNMRLVNSSVGTRADCIYVAGDLTYIEGCSFAGTTFTNSNGINYAPGGTYNSDKYSEFL